MRYKKSSSSKVGNVFAFIAAILLIFALISTVSTLLDYKSIGEGSSSERPKTEEINPSEPDDTPSDDLPTDPLQTPYGRIPEEYAADPNAYPILLFDLDSNEVIWAGDRFGGESTYGGVLYQIYTSSSKSDKAVYFQKDHTDSADPDGKLQPFYNFGMIRGNHIVDLNGYTLTAATNVFHAQAKNKNTLSTVSWTVKNGSINLGAKTFLEIRSNHTDNGYKMEGAYLIENVNFLNITTGKVVLDNNQGDDNYEISSRVVFRDCTFDVVNKRTSAIFNFGETNTATFTTYVRVEGGSFTYVEADVLPIFSSGGFSNKTFFFAEGKDGLPIMILPKTSISRFDELIETISGVMVSWVQSSEVYDDKSIFHLS